MRYNFFMTKKFIHCLSLAVFFVLFSQAVRAQQQEGLGTITGRVMGSLVPLKNAQVVLVQHDDVVAATTSDEDGNFRFNYLDPGYYDIKTVKDGYRTRITLRVPVSPDRTVVNDMYLPKYNMDNMRTTPIVARYDYPRKYVEDVMVEDWDVFLSKPLK